LWTTLILGSVPLVDGSMVAVMTQILENSRKAGATKVAVEKLIVENFRMIAVTDNGCGIPAPSSLFASRLPDWNSDGEVKPGAHGAGLFCLLGRQVVITSRRVTHPTAWSVMVTRASWHDGAEICPIEAEHPIGTTIAFSVSSEELEQVAGAVDTAAARLSLPVSLDGRLCGSPLDNRTGELRDVCVRPAG
jgi:hypothetical protein